MGWREEKVKRNNFIYFICLEEREWEKEGEKHLPLMPWRDQTHNLGRYPDWELNLQPFGLWDIAQPTKPHQGKREQFYMVWLGKVSEGDIFEVRPKSQGKPTI